MLSDLRLAVRNLFRQPGFSLMAIATLGLAIGATAAIFSVVDTVVLRPMPYPGGERMRFVWFVSPQQMGLLRVPPSLPLARDLSARAQAFETLEIYQGDSRVVPAIEGAYMASVLQVRPSLFRLLDGRPRVGRVLVEDDLRADAAHVAVLSHDLWKRRYGGDSRVLEQDIRLDDRLHRIVGVMSPGFMSGPEVWVPLRADPLQPDANRRVILLGVLKEGVTTEVATAELERLVRGAEGGDALLARGYRPAAIDPADFVSTVVRRSSLVMFGAVGLLLLIGCSNVSALLVTRNAARAREIAIRRALGATRRRLMRLLLLEALVLGISGGLTGILIAMWALDLARLVVPARLVPLEALALDGRGLAFTACVSLLTSVVFGVLPALFGTDVELTDAMRGDPRPGGMSRSRHLVRRVLTAAQLAVAVILLVGAGLLVRSFVELQRIPLGFDPSGTITVTVDLPGGRYANDEQTRQFFDRLMEAASGLPGVTAVARATGLPPDSGLILGTMRVQGRPESEGHWPSALSGSTVSDAYFDVMRIPLRQGRTFGPQDTPTADRVAVINETLARRVWSSADPVGQRITFSSGPTAVWATVVGVVGDVKASGPRGGGHGDYQVYYSARQSEADHGSVVVRTTARAATLGPLLRARVAQIDPMLPVGSLATGEERVAQQLAAERFNMLLLGMFAAVGLSLAATGIYGMIGLYVEHRRHELGVRLALGATPRAVMRLVLRQSAIVCGAGLLAGVAAALLVARLMDKLLYEVRATDPTTFILVMILLAGVSLLATVIPIRRALQIDPATTLRGDS